MNPPFDLDTVAAVRQASREHRRNTVACMLAVLDLMSIDHAPRASASICRTATTARSSSSRSANDS
ncbi:MAG: hypothetical protein ACRDZ4_22255 [Egibacteraceae bacterium]